MKERVITKDQFESAIMSLIQDDKDLEQKLIKVLSEDKKCQSKKS